MARRLRFLLAGLTLGLAACGGPKAVSPTAPPPAVQVAALGAPRGDTPVTATGALKRRREMTLSFRIPGVITRLSVDDGDPVRQGEVIATLDPAGVEARLRQTSADLARARQDADRFERLVEKGAISRQQADAQRTAAADAQAAYDAAAFDRSWANLVAPATGVVLSRAAQAGEVVQPGQAVAVIADDASPLVLRAPLSDRDIGRVAMGARARVTLDSLPGETLDGVVSRIGQRAGAQSGAIEIEITLTARPGLRSGLIARARIDAHAPTDGATADFARAPSEAILEADGEKAFVMAYDAASHRARRRAVRFGGFDGDDALVAGLPPDAQVITAGAGYVSDGEVVSVVDPARLAVEATGARR